LKRRAANPPARSASQLATTPSAIVPPYCGPRPAHRRGARSGRPRARGPVPRRW
jgi:hypothetical protein